MLTIVIATLATSAAIAEGSQRSIPGGTYYVDTGTSRGSCSTVVHLDGTTTVSCVDGSDTSSVHSVKGCDGSTGHGYCAFDEPYETWSGTQLRCSETTAYNVNAGSEAQTCERTGASGGSMTCTDESNTQNVAQADCEGGCGNTSGTGCCCQVGTANCDNSSDCQANTDE